MTIATTNTVAGPFNGNDVATSFPFTDIKVLNNSDLVVILTDAAGAETTLTESVDYTLVLNADQDASPGGTITYPVSGDPLATGEKLTGKRTNPKLQGMDLTNQGKYDPEVVETSADKAVMLIQELQEEIDRSIKVSISSGIDPDTLIASIETSESNAAASASAASTSASNAATSESNSADNNTYAAEWANKAEDSLVSAAAGGDQINDFSALHWSMKAEGWAITTGAAISGEYSAKEYAIGTFVPAGSSKQWATEAEDTLVNATEYSAKHYAAKAAASAAIAQSAAFPIKDWGTVTVNSQIDLEDAEMHVIEVGASITLTFACAEVNDKSTICIHNNGGYTITVAGVDNNSPTLTVGTNVQDILGLVKSHGKITAVGLMDNVSAV